jgi:hypothetical protein
MVPNVHDGESALLTRPNSPHAVVLVVCGFFYPEDMVALEGPAAKLLISFRHQNASFGQVRLMANQPASNKGDGSS